MYKYKDLPVSRQIKIENEFKDWKEKPSFTKADLRLIPDPNRVKQIKDLYSMFDTKRSAEIKADKEKPIYYKLNEKNYAEATRILDKPINLIRKEASYKEYLDANKKIPSWILRDADRWTGYTIPSGKYRLIQSGIDKWGNRFISLGLLNKKNEVVSITAYKLLSFKKRDDLWQEFNKIPSKYRLEAERPIYFKVKSEIIDYETARLKARRRRPKIGAFGYFNPMDSKTSRYHRYIKVKYIGTKKG